MKHEPLDESPSHPPQVGWLPELEIEALRSAADLCEDSSTASSSRSEPQAEDLSMSSVWQMESLAAADAALAAADRSCAAIDDSLAFIAASNARIAKMERR